MTFFSGAVVTVVPAQGSISGEPASSISIGG
jgi:hypothetical protein